MSEKSKRDHFAAQELEFIKALSESNLTTRNKTLKYLPKYFEKRSKHRRTYNLKLRWQLIHEEYIFLKLALELESFNSERKISSETCKYLYQV